MNAVTAGHDRVAEERQWNADGDRTQRVAKRVLLVEDDADLLQVMAEFLEGKGFATSRANGAVLALHEFRSSRPDIAVIDYSLPDGNALELMSSFRELDASVPVLILTGHGSIDLAVRAMKQGAEHFLTKPVELQAMLVVIEKSLDVQRIKQTQLAGKVKRARYERDPFLGVSDKIQRVAAAAQAVVGTDRPILIQGETGTGKGILAGWLHANGPRCAEPFVDLNCAGLSRELLETELFGHEKGAFTGAVATKLGLVEVAHRGTLLLDEIGDMDLTVQPKLLKVLEDKHFRRLGDVSDRSADVHVIAATHRSLPELVRQSQFRSDLYFRVSTITIHLPALRERVEDIPLITEKLLAQLATDMGRFRLELTKAALDALQRYAWPGNIRELRNVLERAALVVKGGEIRAQDLNFDLQSAAVPDCEAALDLTLAELESRHIQRILQIENGNVAKTANRLGISRTSVYTKIKEYGLGDPNFALMQKVGR
jgi:DNA-binding NtrC family response regulator